LQAERGGGVASSLQATRSFSDMATTASFACPPPPPPASAPLRRSWARSHGCSARSCIWWGLLSWRRPCMALRAPWKQSERGGAEEHREKERERACSRPGPHRPGVGRGAPRPHHRLAEPSARLRQVEAHNRGGSSARD
jgi:hypothetical protein